MPQTSNSPARYAKSTRSQDKPAPTACRHAVSGTISLPFRGTFHLSLTVLVRYRSPRSTEPWRVVPPASVRVSRERTYSGTFDGRPCSFVYGTIALYGARFHALRLPHDFVTSAGSATTRNKRPTTPDAQRVAACTHQVWADPFSLATTQGVSVDFLSSGY